MNKENMSITPEDLITFKEGDAVQIKSHIESSRLERKYQGQTGIIVKCVEIAPKVVYRYIICLDRYRTVIWASHGEIELHYQKDKAERLEEVRKKLSE